MNKLKTYRSDFKLKVTLEVLREEESINQIASRYQICPKNVQYWKKQFLENAEIAFNKDQVLRDYKKELSEKTKDADELYRQIGELTAQLNWAKKKIWRSWI